MGIYERTFTDYTSAKKCADIVGGTITQFISIDENENYIIIYAVRYNQLFW